MSACFPAAFLISAISFVSSVASRPPSMNPVTGKERRRVRVEPGNPLSDGRRGLVDEGVTGDLLAYEVRGVQSNRAGELPTSKRFTARGPVSLSCDGYGRAGIDEVAAVAEPKDVKGGVEVAGQDIGNIEIREMGQPRRHVALGPLVAQVGTLEDLVRQLAVVEEDIGLFGGQRAL